MATAMYWGVELMPAKAIPMTMAREAPVLMPRMPGSAMGLRVTACMRAPDRPRAAPAHRAVAVRGMRSPTTTAPNSWLVAPRPPTISPRLTILAPKEIEARAEAATSTRRRSSVSGYRLPPCEAGAVTWPCRRRRR